MALAVAEYLGESWAVPALKQCPPVSCMGLALVVLGESLRKAAMVRRQGAGQP